MLGPPGSTVRLRIRRASRGDSECEGEGGEEEIVLRRSASSGASALVGDDSDAASEGSRWSAQASRSFCPLGLFCDKRVSGRILEPDSSDSD